MEIYPAIDLYEGKVVRLERGDYQKCKVYSSDPALTATQWADQGARWLHIVDLEGARSGELKNGGALKKILSEKRLSVQFGGGIRRKEDLKQLFEWGVDRVVLGTKVLDPPFLGEISEAYGDRIAVSLDLRGEEVQVEGWLRGGKTKVFDLLQSLRSYKISCVIVTDIERDGTLTGLDLPKMRRLLEASPFPVICSGGIRSLEDIRSLVSLQNQISPKRFNGAIVGKALYEGRLDLKEALRLAHGENPS